MGAKHGLNYQQTADLAPEIRRLTDGRGVDVVFDAVGAATWPVNLKAVRKGGRIVLCGVTTGATAEIDLQNVYWNQLSILGSTMGSQNEFGQMLRATAATRLKPVVDSVWPLEKAPHALARMARAEQFGKIVLEM